MKTKLYRLRLLMEQAGNPTDTGTAGNPDGKPTDTPPAGGADNNPPPAGKDTPDNPTPAKNTDTPPAGNEPAPGAKDTNTLLGGATDTPPANGSADNNPDGGKQTGDGKQEPPQDPYKDLSLPDGAAVNEAQMTSYKTLAKELNLSPESAQRILDFEAKRLSDGAAQAAHDWTEQVKQEHGDKLPTVLATCARAINKLGGDELRTLLNQTGLGNHPLMVKAFFKAGSLLSEDKSVSSGGSSKGDVTFTQALYGNRPK